MAHLGEEKLFLDVEHPSKGLLGEIGNRILEYLGYKRLDGSLVLPDVYAHEVFTYPFIKKAFHMKWKDGDLKADNQGEKLIPVPFNLNTLRQVYGEEKAAVLEQKLKDTFGEGARKTFQYIILCLWRILETGWSGRQSVQGAV